MAYTSDDIILWGKISQPFSIQNETRKKALTGSSIDKDHHIKLYVERKSVEWYNDQPTQDADILYSISNWLFALEGVWGLKAQFVNGGSGGQVAPISPSGDNIPNVLDWIIEATSSGTSPMKDGDRTVTLDGSNGTPDYRGYNINFFRGGVTQNTTPLGDGSTYYSWNRATAQFTLFGTAPVNGAAQLGELFRITPDLIGVGNLPSTSNAPDTIYLDTDGTYVIAAGYAIWKIRIKPTAADTVKIGTTLAGDEIMFDKVMTPNVYGDNGVTYDVGEGASQTIYFTGFTSQAQIDIYLLPI